MVETTNFGLKTYEADDVVNVMTVDKSNMEIIDSAMKVNQDAGVGVATELVTGTVHALTRLNPDIPVFRFTATSNFTAGETFVVDGVQVTALLPSGETLGTGAYIVGSEVMCAIRDTLLTVYVPQGQVATASDSEKLGGQLPEYYATKTEVDTAQSTATASGVLAQSCQSQITTINNKLQEWEELGTRTQIGTYTSTGTITLTDSLSNYRKLGIKTFHQNTSYYFTYMENYMDIFEESINESEGMCFAPYGNVMYSFIKYVDDTHITIKALGDYFGRAIIYGVK